MNDLINIANNVYALIALVISGFGSIYLWVIRQKKKNQDSTDLLYAQLEELKKKIIAQVNTEIQHAESMAAKDRIIFNLKNYCPDCYQKVIKDLENENYERPKGESDFKGN